MATLNSTTINLVRRTALELLIRGVTKNDDELILFFGIYNISTNLGYLK